MNVGTTNEWLDWHAVREEAAGMVIKRIGTRLGIPDLKENIVVQKILTPRDFAERDLSWRGSLYGFASHGTLSAFQRPPLHDPRLPGVYFVGGTTHPGGGIPLVLLGARIVARKILRKLDLPFPEGDVPEPAQ